MACLGELGSQSSLEPRLDLVAVLVPLAGVGNSVTVGGLFGVLQALEDLGHIDAIFGGEGGPGLAGGLAPRGPFSRAGSLGSEKGREGGTTFGGEGLASVLGVVVVLPLCSVLLSPCSVVGNIQQALRSLIE